MVNVPAVGIAGLLVTTLLVLGTRESAAVNAVLVCIKVAALVMFIALALPVIKMKNFHPFAPLGTLAESAAPPRRSSSPTSDFDAVSTAAEETINPQRNMPIGLIGSLVICTVFYLLVAARRRRLHRRAAGARCGRTVGIEPGLACVVRRPAWIR